MSNTTYLNHLATDLTTQLGVDNAYGKNLGDLGKTTEGDDEVYIGYKGRDANGNLITSPSDGDFERDTGDTGVFTLDTAGGNDYVRMRDDQNAYTVTQLGTGDDTYHINGALDSTLADIKQGNDDARAYVFGEEGDDSVTIGHIDGGRVFTGSGSDNVIINDEVDDGGVIDLGSGKSDYANGNVAADSADDEDAINNLHIKGSLGESSDYDYGMVIGGNGKDNVVIDGEIEGKSVVDLGDNDDTVSVHHMQHNSQIITGNGDDVVNVVNSTFDNTVIDTSGEVVEGQPGGIIFDPATETFIEVPGTEGKTDNDVVTVGYSTIGNSKIITGEGDDRIEIADDVDDNSSIFAGEGNDTLIVGDDVENTASIDMGEGDNRIEVKSQVGGVSTIVAGSGNDVLDIGYALATRASVDLGEGDNTITTGDDVDGNSSITVGSGDDVLTIGDDVENNANINMGEGNNTVTVRDQVGGASTITAGAGDDVLDIGYALATRANVDLGDGNNTITIGDDVDGYTTLKTGDGDDTLSIGDDTEDGSYVNLGNGNNTVTIADDMEDSSALVTGNGSDSITVDGSIYNHAYLHTGDNDDVVTVGVGIYCDASVNGGEGFDTLNLEYDYSTFMTTANRHVTNVSSENFSGFEEINMNGTNAVDIRFADLVQDTDRDGALFINGGSEDKVDLGSTNWNSDNADKAKFDDATGGNWNEVGTETVNGVVYNVYHHSFATDATNDVYIEQGVMVI